MENPVLRQLALPESKRVRKVVTFQTSRENGKVTNRIGLRHQNSPEEDRRDFSRWCVNPKARVSLALDQIENCPTIRGVPIPDGSTFANANVKWEEIARLASVSVSTARKLSR